MGELVSRILVGALLLAFVGMGVYFGWRTRRSARDPQRDAKETAKLRERLGKVGLLTSEVSPENSGELLKNWLQEQRRIQISAPVAFCSGALSLGIVGGVFVMFGVSLYWAWWSTLLAAMAGSIGYFALAMTRAARETATPDNVVELPSLSTFRPRFVLIAACIAVAYSAVVSLLLVIRLVPREPGYVDTNNIASLLNAPFLLVTAPLAAFALLVLIEVGMRRMLNVNQPTFSGDPVLQRRAIHQWFGERVGAFIIVEGALLPLFTLIGVSDLSRPFAFPLSDIVGGLALMFAVVTMFVGFAAALKYTFDTGSTR